MEVINMKLENDYPVIYQKINRFLLARKIVLICFLVLLLASIIVNLCVGGKLWCLYVLGGEVLIYFSFLNRPLIDNGLTKRITILLLIVILYLDTIDFINQTNWSYLVIDILTFSLLLFQIFFFFIKYEYHKNKIILIIFTSFCSIIFCGLAILKVIPINWAVIVTGSIGIFNILILLTFYFKTTRLELKKYFSLK